MESRKKRKISIARGLRKRQTATEKKLWWLIRNRNMLGVKFRRQYIVKGFVIDFYCPSVKLGIEIDGGIHLKQQEYDKERQKIIEETGIKMIRFTNSDVDKRPEETLEKIVKSVNVLPSPRSGEGGPRANVSERRGG